MKTCVHLYLAEFFLEKDVAKIKAHFVTFPPENRAVYMYRNIVESGRPQMAI